LVEQGKQEIRDIYTKKKFKEELGRDSQGYHFPQKCLGGHDDEGRARAY